MNMDTLQAIYKAAVAGGYAGTLADFMQAVGGNEGGTKVYGAGIATAYGAAVRGGYTGTYDEWCALMADYATVGEQAAQSAQAAQASAENAATSESNAAASAGEATTQATAAATSAANAAQSATNAAASKAAAQAAETNAADSATAAAGSASAAATSATNAAASEAAAQAVARSIPSDYSALSADVDNLQTALFDENALVFEIGSIVAGNPTVSTKYCRTVDFIPCRNGMKLHITNQAAFALSVMSVYYYSDANTSAYNSAVTVPSVPVGQSADFVLTQNGYFKLRVAQPDAATDMTASDLAAVNQSYAVDEFYLEGVIGDLKSQMGDLADLDTTDKSSLVAAINEAAQSGGGGDVTDVQVNGVSVVQNGVANVPIASGSLLGVVRANSDYGIYVHTSGQLRTTQPSNAQIQEGIIVYRPITPVNQHKSTFYGLAKAAGDTTQSASSNAVGAYTDEAKAAIQAMLGLAEAHQIGGNFTAVGPLDMEMGGISSGQATPSDKYVRCADFVQANPGDTLVIAPTAFTAKDMVLYKYTAAGAGTYYASDRIATTAAGNRVQYDFTERCYFKIRIAKNEYEVIDASEVSAFEAITAFTHYYAPGDFAPVSEDDAAPLNLDYEALASAMSGKINLALQTDTHMSDYTCYHNDGTAFGKSDFASFYAVLATIEKLGVDAVANLGDIVRGYDFDPDYETRQSLDKIIRGYTERTSAPKMYVIGNHDDGDLWYYGTAYNQRQNALDVLYPYEQFSRITKYGMQNGNNKPYYFADVAGIRFITLWQKDFDYTQAVPNINAFNIGTDQLAWLSGTALNTTLPVVILTHAPLITSLFSVGGGGFADAMAAIQAFHTGGGTVIAVLCGHTHAQASETADGINHIVFDNGYTWFELVSIDLTGRTITCKAVNNTGLADMTFTF